MSAQSTVCPKCGEASSEPDFCSECGARIDGASIARAAAPLSLSTSASSNVCPTCQTPRPSADARYCEVCRYDFVKQTAGEPPVAAAPTAGNEAPAPAAGTPTPQVVAAAREPAPLGTPAELPEVPPPSMPVAAGTRWDVVIAVDPTLDTDPEPDLKPPDEPERRIPLDRSENLIGRRDANQNIVPDVRPHDPSVSRRHAKLLIQPDNTVAILDLDSANGTFVNGEQILGGVPRALRVDDVVTIGRWTRLRVEPRS
jgi:FHA domain/Double zinc ribbon